MTSTPAAVAAVANRWLAAEQPVLGAAGDVQRRDVAGSLREQREQVVAGAGLPSKTRSQQLVALGLRRGSATSSGAGQAGRGGVPLGVGQGELERAVPAHREPGDVGVRGLLRDAEELTDTAGSSSET